MILVKQLYMIMVSLLLDKIIEEDESKNTKNVIQIAILSILAAPLAIPPSYSGIAILVFVFFFLIEFCFCPSYRLLRLFCLWYCYPARSGTV